MDLKDGSWLQQTTVGGYLRRSAGKAAKAAPGKKMVVPKVSEDASEVIECRAKLDRRSSTTVKNW